MQLEYFTQLIASPVRQLGYNASGYLSRDALSSTTTVLGLLLCTESPVLEAHLASMAFSASTRRNGVFASAPEAYFKVKPSVLRYLFLGGICNRHVSADVASKGYILPFYSYAAKTYSMTRSALFPKNLW